MESEKSHGHKRKRISLDLEYRNSIDGTYILVADRKFSIGFPTTLKEECDPNAPKDPYNFVLITLFFLGFASMLPFTINATANEYWMYKFRNVSEGEQIIADNRTPLQMAYTTYAMLVMIAPATLLNVVFSFIGHKIEMNTRARTYYFMLLGTFLMHFLLSIINTDSWQGGLFWLLIVSQLFLSLGFALGMVIIPIANKFPKKYFVMNMIGSGLEALLTSLIRLFSVSITSSNKNSGTVYFGFAVVLMIIAIIFFEVTSRTDFYKCYVTRVQKEDANKKANSLDEIKRVFKKTWKYALLALLNVIAPAGAVLTLVVSKYQGSGSLWADTYFVTVCTYLIPSVAGIVGRGMSELWEDGLNVSMLFALCLGKMIIFTPLTFICNAKPRHNFPVLLGEDWEYAVVGFFNPFLTGYLSNVIFIRVSKLRLSPEHTELAFRILTIAMTSTVIVMVPLSIIAIKIL